MSSSKKDYLDLIKNFTNNESIQSIDLEMVLKSLLEESNIILMQKI